jgi:hypothetical protein
MILPIYEHLQQENRRLRLVNADLLIALQYAADVVASCDDGNPTIETGWDNDELLDAWLKIRAAIASARDP